MSKRYALLILVIATVFISSCCKKRVYCDSGSIKIAFVGFQPGEVRTVVLKRYKIDEVAKALDSAQLVYNLNILVQPNKKDTMWLSDYTTVGPDKSIYFGNDWTLTINSSGQRFHITALYNDDHRYEIEKCSGKETGCISEITAFTLNGAWNNGNVLYIQK